MSTVAGPAFLAMWQHICLILPYNASLRELWDEMVTGYERIHSRCPDDALPFLATTIASIAPRRPGGEGLLRFTLCLLSRGAPTQRNHEIYRPHCAQRVAHFATKPFSSFPVSGPLRDRRPAQCCPQLRLALAAGGQGKDYSTPSECHPFLNPEHLLSTVPVSPAGRTNPTPSRFLRPFISQ
ncbi:hypothetical protein N658DRAFT_104147 [Parathielavia hyrcaniae]|uniref:Uncharacterized protein n=1 Tax=Parathielavia hyrcaniae TaxID=113614 RepID=A0AAN6PYC5_9PEZI|nr:hypothetical protein N658DRAFT_104147 [Parathielavia hyrcaniae]